jgi:hypothetical protein
MNQLAWLAEYLLVIVNNANEFTMSDLAIAVERIMIQDKP